MVEFRNTDFLKDAGGATRGVAAPRLRAAAERWPQSRSRHVGKGIAPRCIVEMMPGNISKKAAWGISCSAMGWILDILYLLGLLAVSPALLVKSLRTGKYRSDWPGRLGRINKQARMAPAGSVNSPPARRLLIHCVSVGELLSTRRLVEELLGLNSALIIFISTTTDTGVQRAQAIYADDATGRVRTVRYPLDFSFAVRRFLKNIRPDMIVLVELETWPNFIFTAARRSIPIRIINGRITARSFRRYRLVRPIMAAMFRRIEHFGVQTQSIAARFAALGAPADRIEVIPTLKYDTADFSDAVPGAAELAAAVGIIPEHALLVGGSTGPGEQESLLECYLALRRKQPTLRLAIAPRKPEVIPRVIADIKRAGLAPLLRSEHPDGRVPPAGRLGPDAVLVLNTMGELKKLYSLATMVFSGRSLVKLGGSDMIEAAAMGKPCCFGPHTYNFDQIVQLLLADDGAVAVKNTAELTRQVESWLANPRAAGEMGRRASACLAAQRGATKRYARQLIERLRE